MRNCSVDRSRVKIYVTFTANILRSSERSWRTFCPHPLNFNLLQRNGCVTRQKEDLSVEGVGAYDHRGKVKVW